jgi:hypothetical protein
LPGAPTAERRRIEANTIYFNFMAPITTSEELLQHLATRGDPSAFHTLVAKHALSTYVMVRNSGKNHEEAVDLIIPFLAKLHSGFHGSQTGLSFAEWYEGRQKKLLPLDQSRDEEGAEAFLEAIPPEDIARFDACICVAFQRNASALSRAKGGVFLVRVLVAFATSNKILRTAIIVVIAIVAAIVALCASLAGMHASLSLAFSKDSHLFTIELPGAIPGFHRQGQQVDSRISQRRGDIAEDSAATKSAAPNPIRDSAGGSSALDKQTVAKQLKGIPAVAQVIKKRQAWHSSPKTLPDSSAFSSSISGARPAYKSSLESEKDTTSRSVSDKHLPKPVDSSSSSQ